MAGNIDSEHLLKFIGYSPDYLSGLSRTLLRFFGTTFVETAAYTRLQTRCHLQSINHEHNSFVGSVRTILHHLHDQRFIILVLYDKRCSADKNSMHHVQLTLVIIRRNRTEYYANEI